MLLAQEFYPLVLPLIKVLFGTQIGGKSNKNLILKEVSKPGPF